VSHGSEGGHNVTSVVGLSWDQPVHLRRNGEDKRYSLRDLKDFLDQIHWLPSPRFIGFVEMIHRNEAVGMEI
jgi:hypothetical protein